MTSTDPDAPAGVFPLSAQQEYHWETLRLRSLGRGPLTRDGPFIAFRLTGELDLHRLRAALATMTGRHESLRTVLTDLGPEPGQRVVAMIEVPLSYLDLTSVPGSRRTVLADNLVAAERDCDFDLLTGPLWSCLVMALSPATHVIALHFCHLIIDGVSLMGFLDQLWRLYAGEPVPVPRCQYRHYVEQSRAEPADLERRLEYWRRELLPLPPRFAFPTDYAASPPALVSPATLPFRSRLDGARLRDICRAASVTPFMLHLAAYAIVLTRTGGSGRVVFGSSVARLDLKPDSNLLGYFLDMMLIPIRVRPKDTLGGLLSQVRQAVLAGHENVISYTRLAEALNPHFHRARPWPGMNLYDAWVRGRLFESVTHDTTSRSASFGGMHVSLHALTAGYSDLHLTDPQQADLYTRHYLPALYLDDANGSSGYLEYNSAVFSPETADRISRHLLALIGFMASPDTVIDVAWNAVKRPELPADPAR